MTYPVPVASPCINLCRIDPETQLCEGCFRTLEEIVAWGSANDASKHAVWQAIKRRQQAQEQADLALFEPKAHTGE